MIQWKEILAHVINPSTGKTLLEENRWTKAEEIEGVLHIQYRRDGINPLQKRDIEKSILNALDGKYNLENVRVYTISDRSADVYSNLKKVAEPEAANLKVGHAPVGNKRAVPGIKKIIAVGSGKGGVGKSTFSVNLAISLMQQGKKVGLIDADIYGPSVPKLLGAVGQKPYSNDEKKIIPLQAHGLSFMSFGLFIDEQSPVIWRGPMLGGVLNQFLFDVDWSGVDYLIIDLPPGTGDVQLSMVQNTHVDAAIVICTPQDLALLDAVKGLEMFRKLGVPVAGMVENMSTFICDGCGKEHELFGHGGVKKTCEKLDVPYLGSIPLEMDLRVSSDSGTPFMTTFGSVNRPSVKAYEKSAHNLIETLGL
jgi:ATP-binding protein involved in chromosome partitioning